MFYNSSKFIQIYSQKLCYLLPFVQSFLKSYNKSESKVSLNIDLVRNRYNKAFRQYA